jgi:hypothetical protein
MQPLQRPQSPQLTPEQLAAMDHAALYMARYRASPEQQNQLANYEHRAFAREATQENLFNALPIAAGSMAYPFYKMLISSGRSDPSFGQVGQGLLGVGEGIAARGQGAYNKLLGLLR